VNELTTIEAQPVAIGDPESLLRFAVEKGAHVDTIERLMAVRRELKAEAAKQAFDAAMAAFQSECPVIDRPKSVSTNAGQKAYSYAPFEHIIAIVKPCLKAHGFSYTLDTDTESAQGWVIAKCHVTHSGGHVMTSTAKFPLGTKTGIMSETQVFASALTFASRRVFCNAFGIVTSGEDQNGATGKEKPRGPSSLAAEPTVKEYAAQLWALLSPVRGSEKNWKQANQWLWDEGVIDDDEHAPDFTAPRFIEVIAKAKGKL
jgi:hypothetical protein